MTTMTPDRTLTSQSAAAILSGEFDKSQLLLPYQKRWIADSSQLKIAEKSRRTGLTWAEAADAALNGSMSVEAGGCDTFYVGTTKDMAREFIDACAMWAKAYDRAASGIGEEVLKDEDKDILVYVIQFASGYKIKALSSNPSNLRGMQGNVIIDEAAFQADLAAVLKAALALTMWGIMFALFPPTTVLITCLTPSSPTAGPGKNATLSITSILKRPLLRGCISASVRSQKKSGLWRPKRNGWLTC